MLQLVDTSRGELGAIAQQSLSTSLSLSNTRTRQRRALPVPSILKQRVGIRKCKSCSSSALSFFPSFVACIDFDYFSTNEQSYQLYDESYQQHLASPNTLTLAAYVELHNNYVQEVRAANAMADQYNNVLLPQLIQVSFSLFPFSSFHFQLMNWVWNDWN